MSEVLGPIDSPGVDTDEQSALRSAVVDVLRRHGGSDRLRAAMASTPRTDLDLWRTLTRQVGVAALAIPERFGGVGASLVETHIVLEELGRQLAAVPMLGSAVLAAQAVLLTRDDEAAERLLPGIAEGETVAALCWADAAGWGRGGVVTDGGLLTGTAHYVLDGEFADVLLVVARSGGQTTLHEVASDAEGVTRTAVPLMDPTRALATVTFEDTPSTVIAAPGDLVDRLLAVGAVALSAEQVGVASGALDRTVAHTSTRTQFGRPVGSFQALKHRMADMFAAVETARSISYDAVDAVVRGSHDVDEAVAAARMFCSDTVTAVAGEAVQMHGGIGITWEHDIQLFFKRAHATTLLLNRPWTHAPAVERAVGL
ncbi:MAG: acyl-CoA/acyl-ACP dehydrogenase [Gordonia paraffinivorans]